MNANSRTRRGIVGAVLAGLLLQTVGCGTIFFPERKGQPAGALDPKVVALDAVGLLLFLVPGVIAFAVDFNNGTIYLPPDQQTAAGSAKSEWRSTRTASKSPTSAEIELIVREQTGKTVRLLPGRYRATKLKSSQELADLNFDSVSLATTCEASAVRFRCQSE